MVEPEKGGDDPLDATVDIGPRHLAAFDGGRQVLLADHPVRHLDVETGGQ